MISDQVLQVISQAKLPCFVYRAQAAQERVAAATSLLDRYFFPVKACPEPDILRVALMAGAGLDLCSEGDLDLAFALGCPGERCKFNSSHVDNALLQRLCEAGALLDADSLEQALRWAALGGKVCGLRITAKNPKALYGSKFGLPAREIAVVARQCAAAGLRLEGLHLHDHHANLTPAEFAVRLANDFTEVENGVLGSCRYLNIGGGWPMRHGNPASVDDLRYALTILREGLTAHGFKGALYAEPGRWVVGPCGYWAARVVAVKKHTSAGQNHRVIVLDTATPVPCRPSLAPFVVLRDGALLKAPRTWTCDVFGSANTALDRIGANVSLPSLAPGDVAVSLAQGAYTRSLIPPFNERDRPVAIVC